MNKSLVDSLLNLCWHVDSQYVIAFAVQLPQNIQNNTGLASPHRSSQQYWTIGFDQIGHQEVVSDSVYGGHYDPVEWYAKSNKGIYYYKHNVNCMSLHFIYALYVITNNCMLLLCNSKMQLKKFMYTFKIHKLKCFISNLMCYSSRVCNWLFSVYMRPGYHLSWRLKWDATDT